jgi:hypothetical protein
MDFYSFYLAHESLYKDDFNAFEEIARRTSYFTWYEKSEIIRVRPSIVGNEDLIRAGFRRKIRSAVALYDNFLNNGYDDKSPIILRTAENLLPPTADRRKPPTGKRVSTQYFLADGCHRLALLIREGYELLPRHFFKVQCFYEFSPFDSTSLLAQSLPIDPADYFTYLSNYYCEPNIFSEKEPFINFVQDKRPEFYSEIMTVLQVDGYDGNHSSSRLVHTDKNIN